MKKTIISSGLGLIIISGIMSFLGSIIGYNISYISRIVFIILSALYITLALYRINHPSSKEMAKKPMSYRVGIALAYIVPLIVIGLLIYVNWLPFGYQRTFVIDVGNSNDLDGVFSIEEFGVREMVDGKYFRTLNGVAYAVFKPKVVLNNASYTVTLEGTNVSFLSMPSIDFDWDYDWTADNILDDFIVVDSEGNSKELVVKDDCIYFDGDTRLVFPNSSDMFEEGPFAVYVEWVPEKAENRQQLIGHYNWEIEQNEDNVNFMIGRLTESNSRPNIRLNIEENFYNLSYNLLAIYNPSEDGYFELYINYEHINRRNIQNETLRPDYSQDLTIGNTFHSGGRDVFFEGSICNIKFTYIELKPNITTITFNSDDEEIRIPIVGEQGKLDKIRLEVRK
ncbi:MAG: hypothetical protein ACMXYG_04305 [Candidatus Woesearchaeota archaeon]